MINYLKITDALYDKLVIITAGEDETIKFWDTELNLISEWPIKQSGLTSMTETRNFSIQSLDIFACEPNISMAATKEFNNKSNNMNSAANRNFNVPQKQNPYM